MEGNSIEKSISENKSSSELPKIAFNVMPRSLMKSMDQFQRLEFEMSQSLDSAGNPSPNLTATPVLMNTPENQIVSGTFLQI